jgi:DnaK suppressor protein
MQADALDLDDHLNAILNLGADPVHPWAWFVPKPRTGWRPIRPTFSSEEELNEATYILHDELAGINDQISTLETLLEEEPDGGLGRGDPLIARREINRALLTRLRKRAASLEQALAQVKAGTYGLCAKCGNPIHQDRLAVLRDTRVCIQCAQAGGDEYSLGGNGKRER